MSKVFFGCISGHGLAGAHRAEGVIYRVEAVREEIGDQAKARTEEIAAL